MKTKRKRWLQRITVCVSVLCLFCPSLIVNADDVDKLKGQSSDLKNELDNINGELLEIGTEIAGNEAEMELVNNDIIKTQAQLEIAKNNEDAHYSDMKVRIQYIYENQGESLLGMIFSAENLADFVNRVHFVQTLSEYDRDMFDELQDLRRAIEDEEKHLEEQQESYQKLEQELNGRRDELTAKAEETSTDLESLEKKIEEMKQQQLAQSVPTSGNTSGGGSTGNNSAGSGFGGSGSGSGGTGDGGSQNSGNTGNDGWQQGDAYIYPSGPGQLNPWVGVVYFNGHRETYYSQKVLPGYGLSIPGRHVVSDGTIRDVNGYLCLASSDHPKGTMVETSLGMGVVYDSGCASGTIDIYTDW